MQNQHTSADSELISKRRQIHQEKTLSRMKQLMLWKRQVSMSVPLYSEAANGRRPYPLMTMRIHCVPHWCGMIEPVIDDALCKRDPQMHQTKKGCDRRFGMKAHTGANVKFGLTLSFTATAANEHNLHQSKNLLYGDRSLVVADACVAWHISKSLEKAQALRLYPQTKKVSINTE